VPDDLPFVTGAIGLVGTKPSWTLTDECDTLLMAGSNFPYSEFLPEEGKARGVQVDSPLHCAGSDHDSAFLRGRSPAAAWRRRRCCAKDVIHNFRAPNIPAKRT
jgi:hypothetical protein